MKTGTIRGPQWIPAFLAALTETKNVRGAAAAARIAPGTAYSQRKTNGRFAEAWTAITVPVCPTAADGLEPIEPAAVRGSGWRTSFLEALAETSNVSEAARRANIPLRTAYKTRRDDAPFAAKWRSALYEGYDNLEMEVLGYLRDPAPTRKMDVAAALRLLVAHRETVARERALREDDDEQAVLESIDRFIEDMRQRRFANAAILLEAQGGDDGED
jgi:hypothetical protein